MMEEPKTIYTIGYEKSDVSSLIAKLDSADIDILVDVRELPLSRKKGFSKNALRTAVEEAGISYLHVKELGDPKPGRDAAKAGDHQTFVRIFSAHLQSSDALAALDRVVERVAQQRICLLCFEKSHENCHRSIVADKIAAATGAPILHLSV